MARILPVSLVESGPAERSDALIRFLAGHIEPTEEELAEHITLLRERIPIIERRTIERLTQLDFGAEAIVHVDAEAERVYKIIELRDGVLLGGMTPGEIAPDPDGGIRIVSGHTPTLLDMLSRIDLNNRHGGVVFTKISGVTDEGALLLSQPCIVDAYHTDPLLAEPLLPERGLAMGRGTGYGRRWQD